MNTSILFSCFRIITEETKMEVCNDMQDQIDQNPGVKDETIKLKKEPKLVLERINVSEGRVFGDWTDPRSVIEQVEEVMNEPLASDPDNDSDFELSERPATCLKCDKVFKTERALQTHCKYKHPAKPGRKRGPKPKNKQQHLDSLNSIEEQYNPWNVSNLDEFLYFCCPECDVKFKHDTKDMFIDHTIDKHPKSHPFLSLFGLKVEDTSLNDFDDFNDDTEMFDEDFEVNNDDANEEINYLENNDIKDEEETVKVDEIIDFLDKDEPMTKKSRFSTSILTEDEIKKFKYEIVEAPKPPKEDFTDKNVVCLRCDKEFETFNYFMNHTKSQHRTGRDKKPKYKLIPKPEKKPVTQGNEVKDEAEKEKFWCDLCSKGFKNQSQLKLHNDRKHVIPSNPEDFKVIIKQENGTEVEEGYKCEHCDRILKRKIDWYAHKRTHKPKMGRKQSIFKQHDPSTDRMRYRCDKCDIWFDTMASFQRHKAQHKTQHLFEQKSHKCVLCNSTFDTFFFLLTHMKDKHTVDGNYQCPECSKTYVTHQKTQFEYHLYSKHGIGEAKNKCDICQKSFLTQSQVDNHKAVVHEKKSKNLICDVCGIVKASQNSLDLHKEYHHAQFNVTTQDLKKNCDKCQEEFDSPEVFEDHLRTCLDQLKDFKCKECDLRWVSHLSLELHIAVSHQKVNHVCHICGHISQAKWAKNNHLKSKHDESFKQVCHLCSHVCPSQQAFKKHLAVKHGIGEMKYKCEQCGLKQFSLADLNNHKRISHTKDKLYCCEQCPKTFWAKSYLRSHVKIVHEQYKPNKCDLCSEAYLYKRDLIKHKANVHHC